jgi:hypothetical protein
MWKSCNFRITRGYIPVGSTDFEEVPANKCALKHSYNECDMDDCILIRILKFVAPVVDDTIV